LNHFQKHEFECSCGCGKGHDDMQVELLYRLDKARERANTPFKLNSAFRCINYNLSVGGKPDSAHRYGFAVDIACIDSRFRFQIVEALIHSGFTRIGIASDFIHADCDPNKPQDVIWTY
jgi:uncharacterized protein YcbK (DUF882 family)